MRPAPVRGSRQIAERGVRKRLHGQTWYGPASLRLHAPLPDAVRAVSGTLSDFPWRAKTASSGLADPNVLVVEDEALIALELDTELSRLGWTVLGPACTLDEGMEMAKNAEDLIAAVLDVNLNGESVYPLAQALQDRHIPFVFCTGYDVVDPEGRFMDAPVMHKPVDIALLDRKLAGLVALAKPPIIPIH